MKVVRLASFDIFTTLLARKANQPRLRFRSAFRALGFEERESEAFVQARLAAERKVTQRKGPDLYSLDDIYSEISVLGDPEKMAAEVLKQAEIQMEKDQCFAIEAGRELLNQARKDSKKIIFVSDMYLPPALIRELLEKNRLWAKGARLFVSHVEGAAKHGGLFQKICRELKVNPQDIQHYGDNPLSDVKVPRELGVNAFFFQEGHLTRYEAALEREGHGKMADAVRVARLKGPPAATGEKLELWSLACDVIAPLFIPYVEWVGAAAREKKLETLYFVSRDGLIFKEIYDCLRPRRPGWPESRYLYGSRQAWSCIRAAEFQDEDAEFFLFERAHVSPFQVLQRIGFNAEQIAGVPWPASFRGRLNESLRPADLADLKSFLRSEAMASQIRIQGNARARQAKAYLMQEGLGLGGPYGLVDLGWGGNLQSHLDRILAPSAVPVGFYFHLTRKNHLTSAGRALGWLSRFPFRGWDARAAFAALEMFCSAEHGMTTGYTSTAAGWQPVLADQPTGGPEERLAKTQHRAVQACVSEWIQLQVSELPQEELKTLQEVTMKNFKEFILRPSAAEAAQYGPTEFTSRQEGGVSDVYGPALTIEEAWKSFFRGFSRREACWPAGMIERSHGWARALVKARVALARAKASLVWRPPGRRELRNLPKV
jgi:FMN phosphatase YigB (HAD superfamily)